MQPKTLMIVRPLSSLNSLSSILHPRSSRFFFPSAFCLLTSAFLLAGCDQIGSASRRTRATQRGRERARQNGCVRIEAELSAEGAGTGGAAGGSSGQRPCDIYAAGNTPCIAAHSTVRALFGAFSGALYQVKRADGSG